MAFDLGSGDAHKEAIVVGDVLFVALTIAVRAPRAGRARGPRNCERPEMSAANIVGLILSISLTIFLIVALVLPE
mgnify:CR=1 FL=1